MIQDGEVKNVALWDGESPWAPEGFDLIETTDRPEIGPGWSYDGSVFTQPEPLIIEETAKAPTIDDLISLLQDKGVLTADDAQVLDAQSLDVSVKK